MTRRARITLLAAAGMVLLATAGIVTGIAVLRSDWLREKVRQRILAEAEYATGGRAEIASFRFDWKTLTAELNKLTIHGTEPAAEAPLLMIDRLSIGLKVVSLLKREFDVADVQVDKPQLHLIFDPEGMTNIPEPKVPRKSGATGAETILSLKMGRFEVMNGALVGDATVWNGKGENVAAEVKYSAEEAGTPARYEAELSAAPLHFLLKGFGPVDAEVKASVAMEKNRLTIARANVKTAGSEVALTNGLVSNFTTPVATANYKGKVSLSEADRVFKFRNFRHSGTMNVEGTARFVSLRNYDVSGKAGGTGLSYGKVRNLSVTGQFTAGPDRVRMTEIRAVALGGNIRAEGEIRDLKTFHVAGQLERFDAREIAALAGFAEPPYNGILSGPFDAEGTLSETDLHRIKAGGTLTVAPAAGGMPVRGEITARYDGASDTVEFGHSWLELPASRVEVAGVPERKLDVKLTSRNLEDFRPALYGKSLPFGLRSDGSVSFEGTVTGTLENPQIAGHASLRNGTRGGLFVDSLAGDFSLVKTGVTLKGTSLTLDKLRLGANGSASLRDWRLEDAASIDGNLQVSNADLTKLVALTGLQGGPLGRDLTGTLNGTVQLNGTLSEPRATADLTLTKGQLYGETFDSATGRVQHPSRDVSALTATIAAGQKRVNLTARFDQTAGPLAGRVTFDVSSNALPLNQVAFVRSRTPDVRGAVLVKASGALDIATDPKKGVTVRIASLNADLNGTALGAGTKILGDAHVVAATKNGVMSAKLESSFANNPLRGEGTIGMGGDYPVNGKLTFANVGLSALAAVLRSPGDGGSSPENFDGSATGEVTVRGPAATPDLMTASLDIAQLEVHPLTIPDAAQRVRNPEIRNSGPVHATLSRAAIRLDGARFVAPETDLTLGGTIALNRQGPLDLQLRGNVNLALAQSFNMDLTSSGALAVSATIRGNLEKPDFSGQAEMKNAEFHYADFSNGLTNANGTLLFSGNRATIQTFSGESGGGKVEATGFAAVTGGLLTFRIEARGRDVRVRYPEGVSSISDADLTLAGTSERSQASGKVTIRRISINPKSDAASILAKAVEPLRTPQTRTGLAANLNLDIQVETAPDVAFQTSVTQSMQADANLRLRGTATNPALLGRVNITQGELIFFGNKYTFNQGTISFFNPAKIEPVLNVDLETKARGVDVILTVSGPATKLNVSYRSDPPLQFSDIVALLTTGRTPTDPALAVRDTGQSQNLQQIGASALVGQAIAKPVAGRLQRFFGVSRIKIDPQLTGITGSPEARLTIEQQVTPDLLFTYVSDVSSTSTQLIRVEWDFNRRWSAILTRTENGYLDMDFAFKKQFK